MDKHRVKKLIAAVFVLCVFVGVGLAQAPPTVTQTKQKAADFAQPDTNAAAPVLSEVEKLKIELLQVRTAYAQLLAQHDGCKAELGATFNVLGRLRADAGSAQLTAEEATLKAAIEQNHTGFDWSPKTGLFTPKKAETPAPLPKK